MMNEQKVLEKARAYRLAYQMWIQAITDKNNPEETQKLTAEVVLTTNDLLKAITEEAWEELTPMEYPKYEAGEPVIYVNGTKIELGIVKKDCGNDEYFVNYHTGDTAARTHARHLVKVSNRYAYHIIRLDPDGNERKTIVGTTTVDKAFEKLLLDNCPEVEKKLKAFEIIKEKTVDMGSLAYYIKSSNHALAFYNEGVANEKKRLTQEEFDILKEELK